jgi:hypothetical protein
MNAKKILLVTMSFAVMSLGCLYAEEAKVEGPMPEDAKITINIPDEKESVMECNRCNKCVDDCKCKKPRPKRKCGSCPKPCKPCKPVCEDKCSSKKVCGAPTSCECLPFTFHRVSDVNNTAGYNNETRGRNAMRDWRTHDNHVLVFVANQDWKNNRDVRMVRDIATTLETKITEYGRNGRCNGFEATIVYVMNLGENHESAQTVKEALSRHIDRSYLENVVVGYLDWKHCHDKRILECYGIKACDNLWNKIIFMKCGKKVAELNNIDAIDVGPQSGDQVIVEELNKLVTTQG